MLALLSRNFFSRKLLHDVSRKFFKFIVIRYITCKVAMFYFHTACVQVIMANWNESEADYKTRCPYCGSYLVASLTIIKKQVRIRAIQSDVGLSLEQRIF